MRAVWKRSSHPTNYVYLTINYNNYSGYNLAKFKVWGSLAQLQQGHKKWKVQLLLGSKLLIKWLHKNEISFFLIISSESEISMMGRELKSLGSLKKYELRVVLLPETLWESFVPKDLASIWSRKGNKFCYIKTISGSFKWLNKK